MDGKKIKWDESGAIRNYFLFVLILGFLIISCGLFFLFFQNKNGFPLLGKKQIGKNSLMVSHGKVGKINNLKPEKRPLGSVGSEGIRRVPILQPVVRGRVMTLDGMPISGVIVGAYANEGTTSKNLGKSKKNGGQRFTQVLTGWYKEYRESKKNSLWAQLVFKYANPCSSRKEAGKSYKKKMKIAIKKSDNPKFISITETDENGRYCFEKIVFSDRKQSKKKFFVVCIDPRFEYPVREEKITLKEIEEGRAPTFRLGKGGSIEFENPFAHFNSSMGLRGERILLCINNRTAKRILIGENNFGNYERVKFDFSRKKICLGPIKAGVWDLFLFSVVYWNVAEPVWGVKHVFGNNQDSDRKKSLGVGEVSMDWFGVENIHVSVGETKRIKLIRKPNGSVKVIVGDELFNRLETWRLEIYHYFGTNLGEKAVPVSGFSMDERLKYFKIIGIPLGRNQIVLGGINYNNEGFPWLRLGEKSFVVKKNGEEKVIEIGSGWKNLGWACVQVNNYKDKLGPGFLVLFSMKMGKDGFYDVGKERMIPLGMGGSTNFFQIPKGKYLGFLVGRLFYSDPFSFLVENGKEIVYQNVYPMGGIHFLSIRSKVKKNTILKFFKEKKIEYFYVKLEKIRGEEFLKKFLLKLRMCKININAGLLRKILQFLGPPGYFTGGNRGGRLGFKCLVNNFEMYDGFSLYSIFPGFWKIEVNYYNGGEGETFYKKYLKIDPLYTYSLGLKDVMGKFFGSFQEGSNRR